MTKKSHFNFPFHMSIASTTQHIYPYIHIRISIEKRITCYSETTIVAISVDLPHK